MEWGLPVSGIPLQWRTSALYGCKDPLGLVKVIEQDLDSLDILQSTDAKMDAKGYVDVTLVSENAKDVPDDLSIPRNQIIYKLY